MKNASRHEGWLFTPSRIAWHEATCTAIVADLHLGYAATRIVDGESIPDFSDDLLFQELRKVLYELPIRKLIIAGDLVESARGGSIALRELSVWLSSCQIELHIVPGNHDRGLIPPDANCHWHPDGIFVNDWIVLHDAPQNDPRKIIQGHLHPVLWLSHVDGQFPCFLVTPNRIVLPPFSRDAEGVSVMGHAEWQEARCHVIIKGAVHRLGTVREVKQSLKTKPRSRNFVTRYTLGR